MGDRRGFMRDNIKKMHIQRRKDEEIVKCHVANILNEEISIVIV